MPTNVETRSKPISLVSRKT